MNSLPDLSFPENRYFSRGYFLVHISSLWLIATLTVKFAGVRLSVNNGDPMGIFNEAITYGDEADVSYSAELIPSPHSLRLWARENRNRA